MRFPCGSACPVTLLSTGWSQHLTGMRLRLQTVTAVPLPLLHFNACFDHLTKIQQSAQGAAGSAVWSDPQWKNPQSPTTPNTGQGTRTCTLQPTCLSVHRHTGNSDTQNIRTGLDKQTILNPFPRNKEGVQPRRQPKSFNPQRARSLHAPKQATARCSRRRKR